jgi:IMP dehydrogenase/GMP reductase
LLDSVKEKKTELENATLVLSGDATADTSSDLTLPDDESGEDVPEMDSDALDNDFAEPSKTKNPLGREQRMPAKESLRRKFNKKLNEGLAESKKMLNAKIIAISEALKKTDKKKKPIVAKRLAEALRSLVTEAIKKEAKDIKKVKKLDKKKKVTETRVAATVAAKKKEQPEKYCKNKTCLYRTDADYCPKHKQTEKK